MSGESQERTAWIRDALARFEGRLVRYAARLTGNLETGREVVQETFLKLCGERPQDVEGHLEAWLFTVCRRRALDVAERERRVVSITAAFNSNQRVPASEAAPEGPLVATESATQLAELIARLSRNQQEVVRLKFQESMTYKQISDVTGHSVSYVGYLLHMAIKELRAAMPDE